jgi:hypothetical protein
MKRQIPRYPSTGAVRGVESSLMKQDLSHYEEALSLRRYVIDPVDGQRCEAVDNGDYCTGLNAWIGLCFYQERNIGWIDLCIRESKYRLESGRPGKLAWQH